MIINKMFTDVILEHSVATNINEAIQEWEDTSIRVDQKSRCICGHDIVENCEITNKLNGHSLIVGNVCINKFLGLDLRPVFAGLKSISSGKNGNDALYEYSLKRGLIDQWAHDFMANVKRKRKFSTKQQQTLEIIKMKMLGGLSSLTTDWEKKFLSNVRNSNLSARQLAVLDRISDKLTT